MRALYGTPAPLRVDPLSTLLPRLENVRQHGKGYRCDCPVGHKSKGTVAVASGDDGRVLLHCFAGCSPAEIVAAAGLEVSDLFPERLAPQTPEQRRDLRERARQAQWNAALGVIDREATVVEIAAGYAQRGEVLTPGDQSRLSEACQRIALAREVLNDR